MAHKVVIVDESHKLRVKADSAKPDAKETAVLRSRLDLAAGVGEEWEEGGAGEGEGSAVEGSGTGISPELTTAIDLSVNTFLFLDDSGNGTLERNEVLQSLDESRGQGKGQAGNAALMKRRFEEMDWDNNGNISYLEFLFALESWVGIEDQEDSEEDS